LVLQFFSFRFSALTVPFFTIGGEVEAKAKVLDVLYPKDRTTKTVERSFPKKSSKSFCVS
ncbi:hypothetical protein, partial [Parasutterella excrementihominis]|uniref:hypothetical protein n=1 Tax=Parasutterella excrementihominis TaxID=487175 RepID=UPI000EBFD776